jgi:hypothetical protein
MYGLGEFDLLRQRVLHTAIRISEEPDCSTMIRTWTCGQMRLEKRDTNEDRTRIITVGMVRILRSPLFGRTGDERTLPLPLSDG